MARQDFSDSEWRTLQYAPFWASMAIALVDQKVDEREGGALRRATSLSATIKNPFTRELMVSMAADGEALFDAWKADQRTIEDGLKETATLLGKATAEDATQFRLMLIGLAIDTARASGSFFGDKTTEQERVAIMQLATLVGHDPNDAVMMSFMPRS
jgi:hypothetical protein